VISCNLLLSRVYTPNQYRLVMDTGPQNVLGKRPSLVDPLVQLLVSKIEPFLGNKDMEFEGRIGVMCAPSDKRKRGDSMASLQQRERMVLPVLTETVVASSDSITASGKPFRYEFEPNLDRKTFDRIKDRLEEILAGKTTAPNPLFKIIACTTSHTIDEIYKKPYSVRISYPWATYAQEGAEPIEIISKEHVEKLDVWSGFFGDMDEEGVIEDEGKSRFPFDYRLAVNVEKKFPTNIATEFSRADCVMKREKRRTSYDMKAWVVDMTHVSTIGGNGSESGDRFEVEVELKGDLLLEQLDRRAKGKPHGAYQILNDFLYFLRDLCFVFGPNEDTAPASRKTGYPEMTSCEPSDEKKQRYAHVTGYSVFPIIGDYIYRIADEVRSTPQN